MLPEKRFKRQNLGGKNGVLDSAIPFLPQDIINTNILKRLPVKSLLRFQCVCKDWENLIKTESFIKDHLHHSIQNPTLLFQKSPIGHPLCIYSINRDIKTYQIPNVPNSNYGIHFSVVDSTNGLVCFEADKPGFSISSFFIWNPATRKGTPLKPIVKKRRGKCHTAFGFCPISNDYKILMIHYDDDEDEYDGEIEYEDGDGDEDGDDDSNLIVVEVYSLRTGLWKRVDYFENLKPNTKIITANGVMFYCGLEHNDNKNFIVSFDLEREAFTRIVFPAIESNEGFDLVVHENILAIAAQTWSENFNSFVLCLLVLEEGKDAYEERWTWTKKYNIPFSSGLLFPTCIWKNEFVGSVISLPGHNSEAANEEENSYEGMTILSMINLNTKKLRSFAFDIPRCNESSNLFNYVESLVPTSW